MSDELKRRSRGFRELELLLGAIVLGLITYSVARSTAFSPATRSSAPAPAVVSKPKVATIATKPTEVPKQVQAEAAKLDAANSVEAKAEPFARVQPSQALPADAQASALAARPIFEGRTEAAAKPQGQSPIQAQAKMATMKIKQVKSPGGIEAWLVEEHSVPLFALRFVFEGGSSQDPDGKEGTANFVTAMLDEGAGDLDHTKFQERMEELAVKISFEDSRDAFYGSFETLSANRDASLDMLRLALTKPHFDPASVERIKQQLLAGLAFSAKSPDKVASKTWSATAFAGHPYGRPAEGTPESVASITRDDLEAFRRRNFGRDTLRVVAVGDITEQQLDGILDHVFGALPTKAELLQVPMTKPAASEKLKVIEMDVPQSVVQFGMNGLSRKDPDFLPAFVLNQILGGGGFASRLTEEVREKRGLAYSVYSYLQPYRHVAVFGGGVATKNEAVAQSIDVIRNELKRMADEGPTSAELANAKSYLTGSFALRFDTNAKIANQLLWMLQEDMGLDYVEKRNALVEAVTLEDAKRVAKRLLTVDDLIVTVVGKPKGLAPRG